MTDQERDIYNLEHMQSLMTYIHGELDRIHTDHPVEGPFHSEDWRGETWTIPLPTADEGTQSFREVYNGLLLPFERLLGTEQARGPAMIEINPVNNTLRLYAFRKVEDTMESRCCRQAANDRRAWVDSQCNKTQNLIKD